MDASQWSLANIAMTLLLGVAATKLAPYVSKRRLVRLLGPAQRRRSMMLVVPPVYAITFLGARAAGLSAVLSGQQLFQPLLSPWLWLVAIGLLAALLSLKGTHGTKRSEQSRALWLGIIALAVVGALLPFANKAIDAAVAQRRLDAAVAQTDAGNYSAARREFEGLLGSDFMPTDLRGQAEGRKAQVAYKEKNFGEAADLYATILEKYPHASFTENIRVSLWWSLHQLGRNEPFVKAFEELQKLSARHPQIANDPVYLVIKPSLVTKIRTDPGAPNLRDKDFLSKEEQEVLRYLVDTCRTQPQYRESVALAQFLLRDYAEAYGTSRSKELRSWALYQQAEMAFATRDFGTAEAKYRQIANLNQAYGDRAYYRLGRIAELRGDPRAAVGLYADALSVPGGAIQNVVQRRLCWVVENADSSLIDTLLAETGKRPDVLKESVFRRLLVTGRFDAAVRYARSAGSGIPEKDVASAAKLATAARRGTAEDLALIGQTLARDSGLIYDRAWKGERAQYVYDRDPVRGTLPAQFSDSVRDYRESPRPDYYLEQNHWVQAAGYLERSLSLRWAADPAMTLLDSYVHLAEPSSFVATDAVRAEYRKRAIGLAGAIQKRPEVEPGRKAEAQALLASLGLQGEPDVADLAFAIENYNLLAKRYPKDHLANNALMWVGRSCEQIAEEREKGTADYLDAYGQASRTYERVLAEYPSGHVGREAKERLEYCTSIMSAWK